MPSRIELSAGRFVGLGEPCYLVAEVGQNHNGDAAIARRLIDDVASCGVDAVKFCKRDLACDLSAEISRRPYLNPNSFAPTYGEHRRRLELSPATYRELKAHAESLGLVWFATACDLPSVDVLERLGAPFYKIASRDLLNAPLLDYVARTGKPVILSCGMDGPEGIARALETVRSHHECVILLQCTSAYPTALADVNLRAMETLRRQFDVLVGLSDHSQGTAVPIAAAALGAVMIEKHVTLDRRMKGSDHVCSLEIPALRRLARDVRDVERAMGDGVKRVPECVLPAKERLGRSLVASRTIPAGTRITETMLCLKTAGQGLTWCDRQIIVGRITRREIPADVKLTSADVE
ncbi:MAG: N-acetylneuraminate synthase family protein [Planctomycetia bacterium]|nr:N-acetylneuraminate synthase family protein [Planctomycetia bacterium]